MLNNNKKIGNLFSDQFFKFRNGSKSHSKGFLRTGPSALNDPQLQGVLTFMIDGTKNSI